MPGDQAHALRVVIVSACGLRNADYLPGKGLNSGKSDPYCVCEIKGKPTSRFQTQVVKDNLDPKWHCAQELKDYCPGDELTFSVWDSDWGRRDDLLGQVTLQTRQFQCGFQGGVLLEDAGRDVRAVLQLEIHPPKPADAGALPGLRSRLWQRWHCGAADEEAHAYAPLASAETGQSLKVTVKRAAGLRNADWIPGTGANQGLSDPYCTFQIQGKPKSALRTPVIRESLDPVWEHEGVLKDYEPGDSILFNVFDEDWKKQDDFLGCAELASLHFDPMAFEGDLHLSDSLSDTKATLTVRVETGDFQETLGVSSVTGLGIRRKLWATWTRLAHVPVTNCGEDDDRSLTGLHVRRNVKSIPGQVSSSVGRKKREAKLALLDMVWSHRDQVMMATRDAVTDALTADPDMCFCLRRWIRDLVESVWYDIAMEVDIMVESTRLGVAGHSMHDVQSLGEEGWKPPCCLHPLAIRAFLLYHFLPYDRSFLGQLKDPVYIVQLTLSSIPIVRCFFYVLILFLFLCPGPPDEFQLVQYIMMFKAMQFLTSGVGLALMGTWSYYWCVENNGEHTCFTNGPGESTTFGEMYGVLGVIDVVGSCVLVWASFLLLPFSRQNAGLRKGEGQDGEGNEKRRLEPSCCTCHWQRFKYEGRGGRLGGLCRYDFCSFLLSAVLLVGLEMLRFKEDPREFLEASHARFLTWQFRETLFITRVFYGMLALPFALFNLPILSQILTHTVPTGFNKRGAVVAFLLPPVSWESLESERRRDLKACDSEGSTTV